MRINLFCCFTGNICKGHIERANVFHLTYTRSTDHMERRYREIENTGVHKLVTEIKITRH